MKYISTSNEDANQLIMKMIYWKIIEFIASGLSLIMEIAFTFAITVKLFKHMLKRMMHAPMNRYFEIIPSGVIINRFSNDLQIVETELISNILSQILGVVSILINLILASVNIIWVLVIFPFLALCIGL